LVCEAKATDAIGVTPREHTEIRSTWCNGHCERLLTIQAGDQDLKTSRRGPGRSSPPCSNGAGASIGPCSPW
jgi:hypothetical protein